MNVQRLIGRKGGHGIALSQGDYWIPSFPPPHPECWVTFARTTGTVNRLSNMTLSAGDEGWLATWLSHHTAPGLNEEASYIYMALHADWRRQRPDGQTQPRGVIGLGSGLGSGEPPASVPSTVAHIIRLARDSLAGRSLEEPDGLPSSEGAW